MTRETLFDDVRSLAEGIKSFLSEHAPDEWDGGPLGYEVGGLIEEAIELLAKIDKADEILDSHLKSAYQRGFQEGGEAAEFVNEFLVKLAAPENHEHSWTNGRKCSGCGKFDRQYDAEVAAGV